MDILSINFSRYFLLIMIHVDQMTQLECLPPHDHHQVVQMRLFSCFSGQHRSSSGFVTSIWLANLLFPGQLLLPMRYLIPSHYRKHLSTPLGSPYSFTHPPRLLQPCLTLRDNQPTFWGSNWWDFRWLCWYLSEQYGNALYRVSLRQTFGNRCGST